MNFLKENYILSYIAIFLFGIFATLLMQNSQFFTSLSNLVKQNIGVVAVIMSPLIALWIGDVLRKRTDKNKEEIEVLKNLISYRHNKGSHEFLSALNRITLIFDKNEKIKQQVKELWRSYINKENLAVSKQKEIELVYEICKYKKYNISEFEIDNFFVHDGPPITPTIKIFQQNQVPQQSPNSTASFLSDNKTNSITSSSTTLSQ